MASTSTPPAARLEIMSPNAPAQSAPLGQEPVTIGRHSQNRLRIVEPLVSRFHCVIEPVTDGWRVRDLDSQNGTRVNGELTKIALLRSGDVIRIGQTELKFVKISTQRAAYQLDEPVPQVKADEPPLEVNEPAARRAPRSDPVRPDAGVAAVAADAEANPAAAVGGLDDSNSPLPEHIRTLAKLADSLPERKFTHQQIALINARGKLTHESQEEAPARGSRKRAAAAAREGGSEVADLMRYLLLVCFRIRATDIHVEPKRDEYAVRIRVDGSMVDVVHLSTETGVRLTSMVKVLSDIDIAQRNIIQEGHFSVEIPGRRVDFRVSFAPAMFGQKLVLRILDTASTPLHVKDLNLPDWMHQEVMNAIGLDAGMVLVCGPTGSGKTTTLYALVRDIDVSRSNVVTIEDPVEIQIEGVTQIPVNDDQGNSFSALLRSVLRQDPDVILVGEVRDAETARIAMQAAMTGHLVFSTVHAKDTIGTVFRLLDLGVEPFLVASGLHVVISQRLVRQLCPYCKKQLTPTPQQLARMGEAAANVRRIYAPVGCQRCLGTGYAGRRAIFELLRTSEKLREIILKSPSVSDIQSALAGGRFARLTHSGYVLVAQGITSMEEVERLVGGDAPLPGE